ELAKALGTVRETLGGAPIVGCTGGGVIGERQEVEGSPALSVLAIEAQDGISLEPFFAKLAGDGPRDADAISAALAGKLRGSPERAALVMLADPFRFDGRPLLARLRDKQPKLPVVGGLAAGTASGRAPVFAGSERSGRAAASA